MPRKGWKCININEEYYEAIELLAEKKKRSIKSIVVEALEDKYPMTFQNVTAKRKTKNENNKHHGCWKHPRTAKKEIQLSHANDE